MTTKQLKRKWQERWQFRFWYWYHKTILDIHIGFIKMFHIPQNQKDYWRQNYLRGLWQLFLTVIVLALTIYGLLTR